MPKVHFLNVSPGDCTVIEHASGRVSVIDICDGNLQPSTQTLAEAYRVITTKGNFRMCEHPTNPIDYMKDIGVTNIFRFILTHPDMDHMDGFDNLVDTIGITNFWDTGSRREKPNFAGSPYLEKDWDRYVEVRDGKEDGVSSGIRRAGDSFSFANKEPDGTGHGDGLTILAPDDELINDPDMSDDLNEGSYVILYHSAGGKILLPGDAHDVSWDYVINNYKQKIENTAFLLAPHHGRDSNRKYDFLDIAKPKLTLIGCSPSKYIDYNQWHNRGLKFITSNQAGNVVLEVHGNTLRVYVENFSFAQASGLDTNIKNSQGYYFYTTLS